jgi:teichuronic acid biosynthesis glycosyltransferase TuaG
LSDVADVTVVIPAFESAETIGRALASVAAQTLLPRCVIVVDDGSVDATAAAAEAWRGKMNGIYLLIIRQQNAGAGAARNRAVEEANTRYVAFLDADDEWLPEHLGATLRYIDDNGLTLAAHNIWQIENGHETLLDTASRLSDWDDPYVSLYCKGCIATSTVVVDREAVVSAGGFDPTLSNGQDVDLWLAILRVPGVRFGIFSEPLARYFISPNGINAQTARRFRFYLMIAHRWAGEIAGRSAGGVFALWFRMAAIHLGAVQGSLSSGNLIAALVACLRFPVNLVLITVSGYTSPMAVDRNFLTRENS